MPASVVQTSGTQAAFRRERMKSKKASNNVAKSDVVISFLVVLDREAGSPNSVHVNWF